MLFAFPYFLVSCPFSLRITNPGPGCIKTTDDVYQRLPLASIEPPLPVDPASEHPDFAVLGMANTMISQQMVLYLIRPSLK